MCGNASPLTDLRRPPPPSLLSPCCAQGGDAELSSAERADIAAAAAVWVDAAPEAGELPLGPPTTMPRLRAALQALRQLARRLPAGAAVCGGGGGAAEASSADAATSALQDRLAEAEAETNELRGRLQLCEAEAASLTAALAAARAGGGAAAARPQTAMTFSAFAAAHRNASVSAVGRYLTTPLQLAGLAASSFPRRRFTRPFSCPPARCGSAGHRVEPSRAAAEIRRSQGVRRGRQPRARCHGARARRD